MSALSELWKQIIFIKVNRLGLVKLTKYLLVFTVDKTAREDRLCLLD